MGVNSIMGEFILDYGYIIALAVGLIVVSVLVIARAKGKEPGEPKRRNK